MRLAARKWWSRVSMWVFLAALCAGISQARGGPTEDRGTLGASTKPGGVQKTSAATSGGAAAGALVWSLLTTAVLPCCPVPNLAGLFTGRWPRAGAGAAMRVILITAIPTMRGVLPDAS